MVSCEEKANPMGGGVGKKDPRLECTGEEGEMGIADISAPLSHPLHVWVLTGNCHSASETSRDLVQLWTWHCLSVSGDLEHGSVSL